MKYLWSGLSKETKIKTEELAEFYINTKYEKFFVEKEGAFSYYPNGDHATLDGTSGVIGFLKNIGAFSKDKQEKLWGKPEENINGLGIRKISTLSENDLETLVNSEEVNSIRVYRNFPDREYTENVESVFYPKEALVLDIMDLTPRIKHWANTTPQTMGNWVSRETLLHDLEPMNIKEVPIYKNSIPIKELDEILQKNGTITAVGFDCLQVPRYKIIFELEK